MSPVEESPYLLHPTSRPESTLPVPQLLREAHLSTAYLIEMPGNHGDKLACIAAEHMLRTLNIRRVFNPDRADAILLLGQGLMTDIWKSGILAVKSLLQHYPEKPLIVMPSSFHFTETNFASLFHGREQRCVLYARDTQSWKLLQHCSLPPAVEVYCDHDPAFYLEHTPLLCRLRRLAESSVRDEVLIVERRDREHHATAQAVQTNNVPIMPSPMRLMMKTYLWAPKQALHRFVRREPRNEELSPAYRAECEQVIAEHLPWASTLPWSIGDLSNSNQFGFREFCTRIACARAVLTSRLHVGILAAMLGKPTFLRAGRYGKLPGVYEMSMFDWPNVKLFGENERVATEPR